MYPGDLWQEAWDLAEANDRLIRLLRSTGIKLAQNDAAYHKALTKAELQMVADGVAATTARDTSRGLPKVSKLRLLRDCSDKVYDATQEAINNNKLKMRLLNAQLGREWGQAGGNFL